MAKAKPHKPYPSFPLTAHANGQWCKKIRGKVHSFGVWADPEAAVQRYPTVAADLHAGRQPRTPTVSGAALTVKEACNHFLGWQKEKHDAGEMGVIWFQDRRTVLKKLAEGLGKNRLLADLRPEDRYPSHEPMPSP